MIITSQPLATVSSPLASTVLRATTLGIGSNEAKAEKRGASEELVDMRLDEPARALLEREFRTRAADVVVQHAKVRGRGKQEYQYTIVRVAGREIVLLKVPAPILQSGTQVDSLDLVSYVLRGKTVRIFSPDLKTGLTSWFNGLKRSWQREDKIEMEFVEPTQMDELERGEGDLENVLMLDLSAAVPVPGPALQAQPVAAAEPAKPRKIRIFLASSEELRADRNDFDLHFRQHNDMLLDRGLYLKIERWENFLDAMSETRLQDEYNQAVRNCDIFVSLFFTKTGKFTEEEFDVAHQQFLLEKKPLIYTFFKNADIKSGTLREDDWMSVFSFKKKLDKLGHYYTSYDNIDQLKLKFRQQLELLLDGGRLGKD